MLDFSSYRVLESPTVDNCLHQLQSDKCLICEAGFHFSDDHETCVECGLSRQSVFDFCGVLSNAFARTPVSFGLPLVENFSGLDHFRLGLTPFWSSAVYSFGFVDSYQDILDSSIVPSLADSKVHFIRLAVDLNYQDWRLLDLQHVIYNFYDPKTGAEVSVKLELDNVWPDPANSKVTVEQYFPVCADTFANSLTFERLIFMVNFLYVNSTKHVKSATIESFSLNASEMQDHLSSYLSNGYTGKIHPVSYSVNFLNSRNVYLPHNLFHYKSQSALDFEPVAGVYRQSDPRLDFFRTCPSNCQTCSDFATCLACADVSTKAVKRVCLVRPSA